MALLTCLRHWPDTKDELDRVWAVRANSKLTQTTVLDTQPTGYPNSSLVGGHLFLCLQNFRDSRPTPFVSTSSSANLQKLGYFSLCTFACNRDHSWRTSVKFSGFWPHFGHICSVKIMQPPLLCLLMDILYEWFHKWITPYVNMSFLLILSISFGAG